MIPSIPSTDHKKSLSDEITAKTEAFLAEGKRINEIPNGIGAIDYAEPYRDYQSKLAKMAAAAKLAQEVKNDE